MFRKVYDLLAEEVSGENTRNMAADIWRHDRTCSFDEYYKSARYCVDKLKAGGASEVEIISFPATGKAVYGAYRLQRAWDCKDAELSILAPESAARRLCSYRDDPWSLAQGSTPTPAGGIEAPVVIVEGGASDKDYKGVSVKGKIILTNAAPRAVHELAKKKGAVGIVTDNMATNPVVRPTPMDLPDARLWLTIRPEGKLFAFVLTPRQGQDLRKLIEAEEKKGNEVRLRAWVDSRIYDGRHEMVSASLRGRRTDQEIGLVAHLYEPGCNDNASGAAVLLEVMRALRALIRAKKLPRPYRTIRVWLTHEFQSLQALCYERPEETERVAAALNVDMVGEDQCRAGGAALMYQDGPDALPSFINHFTAALMDYFRSRFFTWGNANSAERFFATINTPFWMNDNFISDPSVGIPSVAFIQWPDRFYHTNHDTEDKVDAESLGRVAMLAGTWAYLLASARQPEVMELAEMVADRADDYLSRTAEKGLADARLMLEEPPDEKPKQQSKAKKKEPTLEEKLVEAATDLRDKLDYIRDRELKALDSVKGLLTEAEARRSTERLSQARAEIDAAADLWQQRASRRLASLAKQHKLAAPQPKPEKRLTPTQKKAAQMIPYRKMRGIVTNAELPKKAREEVEKASKGGVPRLMLFWVDGKRSLLDICRLTRLEGEGSPIEPARAIRWAEAMKKAGVLGIRRHKA